MTELEAYIRANAARFDTRGPADGHGERFLARLEAASPQSGPKRPRFAGFFRHRAARTLYWVPAVCLAALLAVRPGTPHYFRWVSDSPKAIYIAYMNEMAKIYKEIPWEQDFDWDAALQGMTEQGTPLFEQLPDELSSRRKGRILKAYYGELLDGAQQLTVKR